MNAPARLWTGEAVLDHALEVAGFTVEDLRRSMDVTRAALEAKTPDRVEYYKTGEVRAEIEGGPDHGTRLRASENIFGWIGLRGSRKPAEPTGAPVAINIAIVSSDAAGHASEAHGVAVRFVGGDRHGA